MKPPAQRLVAPDGTATLGYVCSWLRQRILLDGREHDDVGEDLRYHAPRTVEHYVLCGLCTSARGSRLSAW
jgi:hypothetical protein